MAVRRCVQCERDADTDGGVSRSVLVLVDAAVVVLVAGDDGQYQRLYDHKNTYKNVNRGM